jgi:uncharacterized coiled-coil protein SlyX
MSTKLPIYKYVVDGDEIGMDFNSFVDQPAHGKAFHYFGDDTPKQLFNDEKRIVTGVAISVNQLIYRRDKQVGEYNAFFDKETTREIGRRMMKNKFMHNVNENHNEKRVINGVTLDEIFYIDRSRNILPPKEFENQNLQDGSMIVSYHVTDDHVWRKIKNGEFKGFSIELWAGIEKVNFKTKTNMLEKLKAKLAATREPAKKVFAMATTVDGVDIQWEGELGEGTVVFLKDSEVLAPEGAHAIANEDGSGMIVTLDASGVVTSIEKVEADEQGSEEVIEELQAEVTQLKATIAEYDSKFAAMATRFGNIEKVLQSNGKVATTNDDAATKLKNALRAAKNK